MFAWLKRLFAPKDAAGYTAGEREIFPYWDGKRRRVADPLAVHRVFLTDDVFDIKVHPDMMKLPTRDGARATGMVADVVRRAFDVPPFADGGLTDGECIALFVEFGEYVEALRETSRPLPSSPRPTGGAAADPTTAPSAASG